MPGVTTSCQKCGKQLTVPERYLGRELRCPQCGSAFRAELPAPLPGPAVVPAADLPGPGGAALEGGAVSPTGGVQESFSVAVKHVDVWSAARFSAVFYGVLGVVLGLLLAAMLLGGRFPLLRYSSALSGFAFVLVIVVPIGYAVAGLIGGAIGAALYNVVAHYVGGVRVTLE